LIAVLFIATTKANPTVRATAQTCQVCQLVVNDATTLYASGTTTVGGMQTALTRYCSSLGGSSTTICRDIVDCQYAKIFGDAKVGLDPMQSCYDIGSCMDGNKPNPLDLIDWTGTNTNYNVRCVRVSVLVIHDTEIGTAQETLEVLLNRGLSVQYIVEKNGTIYQMVDEWNRAWHAGAGSWGTYTDINSVSTGIEIVNMGDEAFPEVQVRRVAALSKVIVERWHIPPQNIIAHSDVRNSDKTDVSGWFDWRLFYEIVGVFPNLFDSSLSADEQRRVLQQPSSFDATALRTIQQSLSNYGYRTQLDINGRYDDKTRGVIEAFNRHFCPEIYRKETVSGNDTIRYAENERWYGISQERLQYLIMHS